MAIDAAILMSVLADELANESRAFVKEKREFIQERLSVPVEYVTGPHGGIIVIRSRPGEPARMETRRLRDGMTDETIEVVNQFSSSIYTETPYAERLENDLERLVVRDLMPDFEEEFLDRMVKVVENG